MTINQIYDFLQQGDEETGLSPFDTAASNDAVDAFLERVIPKDEDVTVDLMGLIVDERKLAFKIGFEVACSLLAEGMGISPNPFAVVEQG